MKIGIDLDDVVVEFVRPFLAIYEKETNKKKKVEDIFTYQLWIPLGISREETIDIAEKFYKTDLFENGDLIEGAKEFIEDLHRDHEIVFVTSRPLHLKEKTENFIRKHFPTQEFKIIYTGDFTGNGKTKAQICEEDKIDVLIEDNKVYVSECSEKGTMCFLIDKPWNQNHIENNKIIRVKNLLEIKEHLK